MFFEWFKQLCDRLLKYLVGRVRKIPVSLQAIKPEHETTPLLQRDGGNEFQEFCELLRIPEIEVHQEVFLCGVELTRLGKGLKRNATHVKLHIGRGPIRKQEAIELP